jgi:hypothetical protein
MVLPMKILNPEQEFHLPERKTELGKLHRKLTDVLSSWVKTHSDGDVKRYWQVYYAMRELGWDNTLDVDIELPMELMPPEYREEIAPVEQEIDRRWREFQAFYNRLSEILECWYETQSEEDVQRYWQVYYAMNNVFGHQEYRLTDVALPMALMPPEYRQYAQRTFSQSYLDVKEEEKRRKFGKQSGS